MPYASCQFSYTEWVMAWWGPCGKLSSVSMYLLIHHSLAPFSRTTPSFSKIKQPWSIWFFCFHKLVPFCPVLTQNILHNAFDRSSFSQRRVTIYKRGSLKAIRGAVILSPHYRSVCADALGSMSAWVQFWVQVHIVLDQSMLMDFLWSYCFA